MEKLNYDCQLYLLHKLDKRGQLMLALTCMRFRDIIVHDIWGSKFREFSTNSEEISELSDEEYQKFFALIALHMEKLTIMGKGRYSWAPLTFYFRFKFPLLTELNIQDPCFMHDSHISMIAENCENLRVLRVSKCHATGKYMTDLRKLQQLYVPKCELETPHLVAILRELRLKHLDARGIPHFGTALWDLAGTSLRELHIKEFDIDESFMDRYDKLCSLEVLQVSKMGGEGCGYLSDLLQDIGTRTKALHINNIRVFIKCVVDFPKRFRHFNYDFLPQHETDFPVSPWLTTVEEIHFVHEKDLLSTLPLIGYCVGLEHIYLERRMYMEHDERMHPKVFDWAKRLIQLLKSQTTPRPILNVHITEYPLKGFAQNMIKELHDIYPHQYEVRWVCEPEDESLLKVRSSFVILKSFGAFLPHETQPTSFDSYFS